MFDLVGGEVDVRKMHVHDSAGVHGACRLHRVMQIASTRAGGARGEDTHLA